MKHLLHITFILLYLNTYSSDFTTIPSKSTLFNYWGRNMKSKKKVSFGYPGTGIEFKIVGKEVKLIIQDETQGGEQHTDYLSVEINGNVDSVLMLKNQRSTYDISKLLIEDTSEVRIIKRTETSVGVFSFFGIKIENNSKLIPYETKKHKTLWIGDSFMCGYGNELSTSPPPDGNPNTGFHAVNENNYLSWSSIVSRAFDTEDHQICYSGKGIFRNFDDSKTETIPLIFDRSIPSEYYSGTWNHQSFIPELIVIALGTNDFGPEMTDNTNLIDSTQFVTTYLKFINKLQSNYPNSKIVLITGNALTDFWPAGLKRLTRSRNYNKVCKQYASNPHAISTFELTSQIPPYGEDWHATIATHIKMSKEFIPYVKKLMGWEVYSR